MKRIHLILCVVALLFFASCVNEDERLGLSLVQNDDAINILRDNSTGVTLDVKMFQTDTVITSKLRYNALGSYKDNNFGKISSCIYSQVSLSSSGQNFSSLGTADSVVLSLLYSGAFVKDKTVRTMTMHFKVEELAEDLKDTIHANESFAVKGEVLFEADVNVDMDNDNVHLANDTVTYLPHLRLKLNDSFRDRLANKIYNSNDEFQSDLKGLKITATTTDANGMIIYVDMTSTLSCLTYYYHSTSGADYNYKMPFTTNGKRFMHVDYDYSGSSLNTINTTPSTIGTGDYMYLSCLGMSEIQLDIKNFDSWYNRDTIKGSIINKAELILPVADVSGDKFTYPTSLQCYRIDQDGKIRLLPDETIATSLNSVSYYDSTINAYRVQLTSYLQNLVRGNYGDNSTIYIIPSMRDRNNSDNGYNRRNTANRVVLNGINYSDVTKRPKLNITYSKIENK